MRDGNLLQRQATGCTGIVKGYLAHVDFGQDYAQRVDVGRFVIVVAENEFWGSSANCANPHSHGFHQRCNCG